MGIVVLGTTVTVHQNAHQGGKDLPRPVSKRDQIRQAKKDCKKGLIEDICQRTPDWEPVEGNLDIIRTSKDRAGGGTHRTFCRYYEDVPIICAAPRLFELVEWFLNGPPKGTSTQEVIEQMEEVILATREMSLARWKKATSGLRNAHRLHRIPPDTTKKPRRLKKGELAPRKTTINPIVTNVLDEISKLKEGL